MPDWRSNAAWREGGQYIELAAVRDDVRDACGWGVSKFQG